MENPILTLNVGGARFSSSRDTLCKVIGANQPRLSRYRPDACVHWLQQITSYYSALETRGSRLPAICWRDVVGRHPE